MRIVTERYLNTAAARFPQAARWLAAFRKSARAAEWKNIIELRQSYPHADAVQAESGRTTVVFNVAGNKFRLITAIHFNRRTVYTLRLLTHAEYSTEHWKTEL